VLRNTKGERKEGKKEQTLRFNLRGAAKEEEKGSTVRWNALQEVPVTQGNPSFKPEKKKRARKNAQMIQSKHTVSPRKFFNPWGKPHQEIQRWQEKNSGRKEKKKRATNSKHKESADEEGRVLKPGRLRRVFMLDQKGKGG